MIDSERNIITMLNQDINLNNSFYDEIIDTKMITLLNFRRRLRISEIAGDHCESGEPKELLNCPAAKTVQNSLSCCIDHFNIILNNQAFFISSIIN